MEQHEAGAEAPGGLAGLSIPARVVAAVAVAATAVAAAVHLGMVFLHVAPPNTLSKRHGDAIDDYVYPEFEQNWKLFAPDPLQQNIAVQARLQVRTADGRTSTTRWRNLSAEDGAAIEGNPLPSHSQQNELRRAWDFYAGAHDPKERSNSQRAQLSEQYLLRIVLHRYGQRGDVGDVQRVQVRSATTPVTPPPWNGETRKGETVYRVLPWWPVTGEDRR